MKTPTKNLGASLRLYNTLTKKEEPFVPQHGTEVTMYTCGPTVYGRPHIGNLAAFLMADLLRRWLEVCGFTVKHVKNITDVGHLVRDSDDGEDKIEKQAREEKGSATHDSVIAIARSYEEQYIQDERTLNMLEPAARPRASEYIEQMKKMIEDLLQKNMAYQTSDGIYFDVSTFADYGKLSGNTLENLSAGARVDVNEEKKHPADFALWKYCVGQNEHHVLRWPSPVATSHKPQATSPEGFPGWHIECSAMSRSLLGDMIDIHTGGEDNIFPHHECEIAQSESVTGKKPFVRHWLHRRRIDLKDEKMSKSLGNVLTLSDILDRGYSPQDLRYYFLSVHYRTNLKFSWKGMDDARKARVRLSEWMSGDEVRSSKFEVRTSSHPWSQKFTDAMNADLNTSGALGVLFDAMSASKAAETMSDPEKEDLRNLIAMARHTFGCFEPEEREVEQAALELAQKRDAARAAKDFAASDALRDQLMAMGYEVRDTEQGTVIRRQ